jgi:hypothetical protein
MVLCLTFASRVGVFPPRRRLSVHRRVLRLRAAGNVTIHGLTFWGELNRATDGAVMPFLLT